MIRSDNLLSRPLFRGGGGARGNRSGTSFQNMTAKELMWQLVFFPLWGIIGGILLFGLTVLEIFTKTRLPEVYATIAVIIGACLALAVLLWADCALYVDLPFAGPICHLVGF
jgi:hypothetical protein